MPKPTTLKLERELLKELKAAADPAKALPMQRYMKSEMPYLGLQAPLLRQMCARVFSAHSFGSAAEWRGACLVLWRSAKFREQRYAAIALTGHQLYAEFQTMAALPMYEEMIVSGAWWDYVDPIATKRLGNLLRQYPEPMRKKMLAWSRSSNLWKRRSAILCQLSFKRKTDLALLYACIEPSLGSKQFFLQKAIGWALRQYAWTDPRETVSYVEEFASRISPLSKREALKNIKRK